MIDDFIVREGYPTDELVIREVVLNKVYGEQESFKDKTVVDLGANIGAFSVYAALGGATVHAFEPQPSNFDVLTKNIEKFGLQNVVNLHNVAVSTKEEKLWICDDGGNSFCTDSKTDFNNVEVQAFSLDQILSDFDEVDFIKIDIEGLECEVILSASNETINKIGSFGMEFHGNHPDWSKMVRRLSSRMPVLILSNEEDNGVWGGMLWGSKNGGVYPPSDTR